MKKASRWTRRACIMRSGLVKNHDEGHPSQTARASFQVFKESHVSLDLSWGASKGARL